MRLANARQAILLLALVFALTPGVARAHAAFVSSWPAPGQQLESAPGIVVLRFSEPINVKLSRATVSDPTGQRFEGMASGGQEIRVRLSTNAPGIYTVNWTTVSTIDGHTLQGTFRFGVGTAPSEGSEGSTVFAPQQFERLIAVARLLEYAALLLATGMLVVRRLARRDPPLVWVRTRLHLPLALALVSGLAVVIGEGLAAAPTPSAGAIIAYLTTGLPGAARLSRLIAEALALSLSSLGAGLVLLPVIATMLALAAAGHAAAVRPVWWGIGVDVVHLIAAALWAGGILALATMRPPGGWRGPEGRCLLERFSPVALTAFLITVGTGIIRGTQELGHLDALVASSYGQVLTVKVLMVLTMIPLSLIAWRHRTAHPRMEAALAAAVIGAAALLAAYPLPPGRLDEAEAARAGGGQASALPQAGDLTLGGEAGEVLVGLTLRPGEPGRNEILVYLLPVAGEADAAEVAAYLVIDSRSLPLEQCGPPCRRAEVDLQGDERLEVHVGGRTGGTAVFDVPALPAPDGTALLNRVQERMHALQTYRQEEILRPAQPPLNAVYAFQAPDRLRIEASNGFQTVWVGGTRYLRERPDAPWKVEESGAPVSVPLFVWDGASVVAPRILGTASVEGIDTHILSFFELKGQLAVWFRLWVDPGGLVRRAEMRAQGHFMDHRYYDFDAPLRIAPPVG